METKQPLQEDEIDLVALLAALYRKRVFIVKTTLAFMFVGFLVAIFSPKVFKASAVFVVQNSDQKVGSSISGLAALAGINLQSETGGDLPPSLYPKIVSGLPFRQQILSTKLNNQTNYEDYLLENQDTFLATIREYTIGLPGLIIKSFWEESDDSKASSSEITQYSKEKYELLESLDENISVQVNEKEGFISLSVLDNNPRHAATIASRSLNLLQEYIIQYKTENAQRVLKYVTDQYELKKKEYEQTQKDLAQFKDQNKNISTAIFTAQLQKLQTKYDLIYSVYLELSKQLEQA
ncbi:MAG: Wzz/FepE/Etk N-terminal domain-containing protein, partial [Flavobacteriaceae bacterium]